MSPASKIILVVFAAKITIPPIRNMRTLLLQAIPFVVRISKPNSKYATLAMHAGINSNRYPGMRILVELWIAP